MTTLPDIVGPVLFARGVDVQGSRMSAIVVSRSPDPPPMVAGEIEVVLPVALHEQLGRTVWRYDFRLPARGKAAYRLGDDVFPVVADHSADVRIAYVSCNGQERDDAERPAPERNAMWRRLVDAHGREPFALLLHGGDQLYADEVVKSHPALSAWAAGTPRDKRHQAFTADMREAAEAFYFERYLSLYAQPELAFLSARVPAFMMWDDHDIFDGWGSIAEEILDSPVARGLFAIARRAFMLFQLGETDPTWSPGCDGLPPASLTRIARFPQFSIIAPDLRSERRPTRIMGPAGWAAFERCLAGIDDGDRVLIMSSVPLLGPRLSLLEKLLDFLPHAQKYEDDLRDQWQSRSHRAEWRRMLETLERRAIEGGNSVTILSGEIHLAVRAEMSFGNGTVMHQLVASGIAHPPPPKSYARALGLLSAMGENPLPGRQIRLKALPGCRRTYAAERNFLIVERCGNEWSAAWDLERTGATPALRLT